MLMKDIPVCEEDLMIDFLSFRTERIIGCTGIYQFIP